MTQCRVYRRLERVAIKQRDGEAREIAVKNDQLPAWSEHPAGLGQRSLWIDKVRIDRVRDHDIEEAVRLSARYGIPEFKRHSRVTRECFVRHTYEHGTWVDPDELCWTEMLHDQLRRGAVAAAYFENTVTSPGDLPHIAGANRLHRRLGCPDVHGPGDGVQYLTGLLFNASEQIGHGVVTTSIRFQDEKTPRGEARPDADRRDAADTAGC